MFNGILTGALFSAQWRTLNCVPSGAPLGTDMKNAVFDIKVEKSRFFLHSIGLKLQENHGGRHGPVKNFFIIFGAIKTYFLVEMLIYPPSMPIYILKDTDSLVAFQIMISSYNLTKPLPPDLSFLFKGLALGPVNCDFLSLIL